MTTATGSFSKIAASMSPLASAGVAGTTVLMPAWTRKV